MPFRYRNLTRHDLPELRALQRRLFPVNYNTEVYESLLSIDVISILAFHNDKMISVATGRVRPCKFRPNKYHGYIITLGVGADYRRHRLGSVLLSKLQQNFETRDCKYVYLHCRADACPGIILSTTPCTTHMLSGRNYHYHFGGCCILHKRNGCNHTNIHKKMPDRVTGLPGFGFGFG